MGSMTSIPERQRNLWVLGSFKNSLLEAQQQSSPYRGKGRRQNKTSPWLDYELLDVFKSKKSSILAKKSQPTLPTWAVVWFCDIPHHTIPVCPAHLFPATCFLSLMKAEHCVIWIDCLKHCGWSYVPAADYPWPAAKQPYNHSLYPTQMDRGKNTKIKSEKTHRLRQRQFNEWRKVGTQVMHSQSSTTSHKQN